MRRMLQRDGSWPDNIDTLKSLLVDQVACNTQLLAENQYIKTQVLLLQEKLNIALAQRYAARSEQYSPDQIRLFCEAEVDVREDITPDSDTPSVTIAAHARQKRGRRPLPDHLPRLEVIHDLPEAERYCDHDGHSLRPIGEVISEQLDIVPTTIRVIRHIRRQYACGCGQCIKTAPLPAQPIPKSLASPGLLAHVVVCKYVDALPLYRQERILQRIGVDLPRATLANWMMEAGTLIQPLINLLRDRLLAYDIIQMDETTVQVLKEPGKTAQSQSYLWLQRGGPPDQPVLLYDYDPGRGAGVPKRLLDGFQGTLQTDGYDGYNAVVAVGKLTHLGCFAHVRRKFDEAIKAQGQQPRHGQAHHALALIQKLYGVEKVVRHAEPAARYAYRRQHAEPILDELRAWLTETLPQVPPQTATGKALNYLHHEWAKLIRYLNDGRFEIDNNRAENAIRPFVIGRKNWLFSDTPKGAAASAQIYSLIETAKANGQEPYTWLRHVLERLPTTNCVEDYETLLPWNCPLLTAS